MVLCVLCGCGCECEHMCVYVCVSMYVWMGQWGRALVILVTFKVLFMQYCKRDF